MSDFNLAIIGASFIKRLERHAVAERISTTLDLESAHVYWCAQGGLTIRTLLRNYIHRLNQRSKIDIAIVHIGSNDLCKMSVSEFMSDMRELSIPYLLRVLGCKHVVICQIFHRRTGKYTKNLDLVNYNQRVDSTNEKLKNMTSFEQSCSFWSHQSILKKCGCLSSIWDPDGVHLLPAGLPHFLRSIRGAILSTIKSIRKWNKRIFALFFCFFVR